MEKLLTGILVLLPLAATIILPLNALPTRMVDAQRVVGDAQTPLDAVMEISALQTILEYTPYDGIKWQRLGRLLLNNGEVQQSVQAFDHAQHNGQLSAEGSIWLADALIQAGQNDRAKDVLRQFSLMHPVEPFLALQAAMLQRRMADGIGSLATLLNVVHQNPSDPEINYQTGLILSAVHPDEALQFLQNACQPQMKHQVICDVLLPVIKKAKGEGDSAARFISIGQTLASLNVWDVAREAFFNATQHDPENGTAWAYLAEASQQIGGEGGTYLETARKYAPDDEMVNGLSGLFYRRNSKYELAILYFQQALSANPTAAVWEVEIANTYDQMGDLSRAYQHYQLAVTLDAHNWVPWRALAAFCITRDYQIQESGLPAARKALALYGDSPSIMDLLGTGLMKSGQYVEALEYFTKADALDPHQAAILIHLGQVYIQLGNNDQAAAVLREALAYAQDNRLQLMAQRLLSENGLE